MLERTRGLEFQRTEQLVVGVCQLLQFGDGKQAEELLEDEDQLVESDRQDGADEDIEQVPRRDAREHAAHPEGEVAEGQDPEDRQGGQELLPAAVEASEHTDGDIAGQKVEDVIGDALRQEDRDRQQHGGENRRDGPVREEGLQVQGRQGERDQVDHIGELQAEQHHDRDHREQGDENEVIQLPSPGEYG